MGKTDETGTPFLGQGRESLPCLLDTQAAARRTRLAWQPKEGQSLKTQKLGKSSQGIPISICNPKNYTKIVGL